MRSHAQSSVPELSTVVAAAIVRTELFQSVAEDVDHTICVKDINPEDEVGSAWDFREYPVPVTSPIEPPRVSDTAQVVPAATPLVLRKK
jgi:hypothetical protein